MKRPTSRLAQKPPNQKTAPQKPVAKRPDAPKPDASKATSQKLPIRSNSNKVSREQLRAERERLLLLRESNRKSKRTSLRALNREARRFSRNRRHARTIRVSVFASFAALTALVLATLFTPLLAIQKIEVSGTSRLKTSEILAVVKNQIGVPLTRVNNEEIRSALSEFKLIESFSVVAMPPHVLQIRLIERQPVCIVTIRGVNYVFDVAGINLGQAKPKEQYPVVSISGIPKYSKNYANAISVLLALPVELVNRIEVVEARSQDNVILQLKGLTGQQIIWGDQSNSALKAKVLAVLIKKVPKYRVATIDVSAPTVPVVRYGN